MLTQGVPGAHGALPRGHAAGLPVHAGLVAPVGLLALLRPRCACALWCCSANVLVSPYFFLEPPLVLMVLIRLFQVPVLIYTGRGLPLLVPKCPLEMCPLMPVGSTFTCAGFL